MYNNIFDLVDTSSFIIEQILAIIYPAKVYVAYGPYCEHIYKLYVVVEYSNCNCCHSLLIIHSPYSLKTHC